MKELSAKQTKVLAALIKYPTHKEAAKAVGISERQIYFYMKNETFRNAYTKEKRKFVEEATKQAQTFMRPAFKALYDICCDPSASEQSRVHAARAILEYGLRYTEFNDVLSELENDNVL